MKFKFGKNSILHEQRLEGLNPSSTIEQLSEKVQDVKSSWVNSLALIEEQRSTDGEITITGLRPPQLGGIYAALSQWTLSNLPKTIVMPTGTGKTETMMGIILSKPNIFPLIVVPSDALREQISTKFSTLGIYKKFELLKNEAMLPFVGVLKKTPADVEELTSFIKGCNIIITTASLLSYFSHDLRTIIAESCTHLFIDEAHHVPAPTWEQFRNSFKEKPILQFTATPFREDGKAIEGSVIYNYPLAKAQSEGYFKKINFVPVLEFNESQSDRKIAELAIDQLRKDLDNGFNHLIMARGDKIDRAREIINFYQEIAPEFRPEIIYGSLPKSEKTRILNQLRQQESRIIVCVDMLGEGFDLPQLKIAALHDIHKSLTPTLQFSGRFTRVDENIGEATFIANVADPKVKESLETLYSENPDWNDILRYKATEAIEAELDLAEMADGFLPGTKNFPVRNLTPNLSTLVYKMNADSNWNPENYKSYFGKDTQVYPAINAEKGVLVLVTCTKAPIDWGRIKDINNVVWDLFVIYHDENQNLLFINSSNKSDHQRLAQLVGTSVTQLKGDAVFRAFSGVNRLILQNAGLNFAFAGPLRYVMYTGVDIATALNRARVGKTYKSNFFGHGFENGEKTSIGCSYKGRIWSRKDSRITELISWCSRVGSKITDDTIDVDRILEGLLKPQIVEGIPDKFPIAVDFPESLLQMQETVIKFVIGDNRFNFWETELQIEEQESEDRITFSFVTETDRRIYDLQVSTDYERGFQITPQNADDIQIVIGKNTKFLSEFFTEDPPIIRFEDSSLLEGNVLVEIPDIDIPPFDVDKIEVWDWTGVNLKKESQGPEKDAESVQFRVIERLREGDYDLILDDDDKGEMADVIAIKFNERVIDINLYHCKYSEEEKPGARIDDLYIVCGQVQKSIKFKDKVQNLFAHIKRRETSRLEKGHPSRFEKGDESVLIELRKRLKMFPTRWKIFMVQPGVSKRRISHDQLRVLGATELYLQETYQIPFQPIFSQ